MIKNRFVFPMVLAGLLYTSNLHASLPKDERVPGGVAVVPLAVQEKRHPPKVLFLDQRVAVVKNSDTHSSKEKPWVAIVGIPISQSPGNGDLTIDDGKIVSHQEFSVVDKSYPTEYLEFQSKGGPTQAPDPVAAAKLEKRLAEEKKILDEAYTSWISGTPSFALAWPLTGRISGVYGARRVINGKPRKPHTGIDIAAPQGTPVRASAKGKVINIGEYYFTGKTIVVDHGDGFKTLYCHLHDIKVKDGQKVRKGEVIGTVGKTGRATGPHLHFGVSLNNQRVSPELFLAKKPTAK